MNYYIADLHFGHTNVIRFDNRPFKDMKEMEEELIRRWNDRVTAGDTVYILGDFCWRPGNAWIPLVHRLNGRKVLIRGNHDPKKIDGKLRKMFDDIKDYKEITDNGRKICMSHYPILFYNHSFSSKTYMLCGHVHTTHENDMLESLRAGFQKSRKATGYGSFGQIINVGCMMPYMDYAPRTMDEILAGVGFQKEVGK